MSLGPGGLNIPDTIMAAAAATAAAAASASPSVVSTAPLARVLYLLKLIHLCFIYGVATDAKILWIWLEVCWAPTKAAALAVLSQYLWAGREVCRKDFFVSSDMLHVCGALFMFIHGDRFFTPRHNPDFPAGGMSFWTTRQGIGDMG